MMGTPIDETTKSSERGEANLVERLRRGDEEAFADLIDRYHGPLRRIARIYVETNEIAEEVVQDALPGIVREGFETHLKECPGCLVFFEQIEATIRLVANADEGRVDSSVRSDILARLSEGRP